MSDTQTPKAQPGRQSEFAADFVRDVSEAVYRDRLGADDVAKMIADPKQGAASLRRNAAAYDAITRSYLRALHVTATLGVAK